MAGVVMMAALSAVAVACDGSSPAAPSPSPSTAPAKLSGVVRGSATGARVGGATIKVATGPDTGLQTTANAEGEYRFQQLSDGFMALVATADRHQETRVTVDVRGTTAFDVTIRSLVVLTGIVAEFETGMRIAGATVRQLDFAGNDTGRRATTNGNGVYRFEDLPAGTSNFAATAERYLEGRAGTNANGINTLNFELRRRP